MASNEVFTNVTADQISRTNNSATIKVTVSVKTTSYYGRLNSTTGIAIQKASGYYKYWGWPKKAKWKDGWGSPSYYLEHGLQYTGPYGTLYGMLGDAEGSGGDYSYTWTETVPITRTNTQKIGSKQITVGLKSTSTSGSFISALKTFTVYTNERPNPTFNNSNFTVTVDSDTETTRYIRVSAIFNNADSDFYYWKLLDGKTQVASGTGNISYTKAITKDLFNTSKSYTIEIWGNNGTRYITSDTKSTGVIKSNAPGVYAKINSSIVSVNKVTFKNVNIKDIKEIWIKKDGKVYKTKK